MWIQPASHVRPREIAWLWPGRLAFRYLTLLEGDPDLGKSFLALDLCARLSTNRPMPDGSMAPGPANSIYLFVEDGAADIVRPRLAALGADLDRVFVPDFSKHGEQLQLPRDLARLDDMVKHCEARLVVLDPILAFLDTKVHSHLEQSVRRMLTPLAALAEARDCALLLHRHLSKAVGLRALYRGSASIAFSAACRAEWLVARMPDGDGRCVLAQQKNNLASYQPSLSYELCPVIGAPPELRWHGVTDWSAKSLLNERRPHFAPRRDEAAAFLREFLKDGPKTSRQIWAAATKQGFKEITLRRAARRMEIDFRTVWQDDDKLTFWLLDGQTCPNPDPATDLEPWLGPLCERFPAASPLDEEN